MEQFYTLLTDIGKAKIANATALQKKLELSKIVLGDSKGSYYGPTEQQTQLKNKVWEGEITDKFIDKDNPNWIVVQTIIPSQIGGFTIREAGVVDSEGDLVLVAKYPETYKPKVENGSTKDITINLILEVSNVENVTLKVDPTIIFATKKDIENVKKEVAENTLSKEDIQTTIENIKASDIKTSSGATVETQLADIATDNKRLTNAKDITGAINELFTNANNGKKLISDVVGKP
ncbi:phage tail protein, partial [Clostridium botulinum]|nr:phage tail protein [Clostridium botulinum]NFA18289.1 phage tail protein [Clostridium botulinum]NFA54966.1 phage tail protein [Clostridium botulinum]NFA68360.1 phage tail protein [Clostridium botulinum]NFE17384.1 phage tail protein [Clostridium botulinum]